MYERPNTDLMDLVNDYVPLLLMEIRLVSGVDLTTVRDPLPHHYQGLSFYKL